MHIHQLSAEKAGVGWVAVFDDLKNFYKTFQQNINSVTSSLPQAEGAENLYLINFMVW